MKGLKTILFGAIITALGAIEAADLVDVVPEGYTGIIMAAIGVAIMELRRRTDTPLGRSE